MFKFTLCKVDFDKEVKQTVLSYDGLCDATLGDGSWIEVERDGRSYLVILNEDALESFVIGLERAGAWKPEVLEKKTVELPEKKTVSSAVEADHYKNYIAEMQWLDAMSLIPTLRKPERFKAAVELQVRKYLDRNGSKDGELQELLKARFYLCYLVMYIEAGCKQVSGADVHALFTGNLEIKALKAENQELRALCEKRGVNNDKFN